MPVTNSIANESRDTTFVVVTPSAGPFALDFPVYAATLTELKDDLIVTDDGVETTAFTVAATFLSGVAIDPSITFDAAVTGTIIIKSKRAPRSAWSFTTGTPTTKEQWNSIFNAVIASARDNWDKTQTFDALIASLLLGSPDALVVESVAALRALTSSYAGTVVFVASWHDGLNRGGGVFRRDGTTGGTDDSGTLIVDASGRNWFRQVDGVDVCSTWFGAKADGTDDAPALALAVAYLKSKATTGSKLRLDLEGLLHTVSSIILVTGDAGSTRACNIWIVNGGLEASGTFPIGSPIGEIAAYGWACGFEKLFVDCNFRACGLLSRGGNAGAYHSQIKDCIVQRQVNTGYGIQVGSFQLTVSSPAGTWARGDTVSQAATGASGILIERIGNQVLMETHNGIAFNASAVSTTSGGTATGVSWEANASSQSSIVGCRVFGLLSTDTGYSTLATALPDGIRLTDTDVKYEGLIVTRSEPTIDMEGWQCIGSMNHTFPVPATADTDPTTWRTNYNVKRGGHVFATKYLDNAAIKFNSGRAAASVVLGLLASKYATGISANTSPIRLASEKVNDRIADDCLFISGTYGGNASGDFTSLLTYEEVLTVSGKAGTWTIGTSLTGGTSGAVGILIAVNGNVITYQIDNGTQFTAAELITCGSGGTGTVASLDKTWAEKANVLEMGRRAMVYRHQWTFGRIDNGSFNALFMTLGASSRIQFSDAGTTFTGAAKPSWGAEGNSPKGWYNNSEKIELRNAGVLATGTLKATGGIGYETGAGGAVTQLTNKSTTVVLNKVCGDITMHGAALAAGAIVSFTLTNSEIAATDKLGPEHISGGTLAAYTVTATPAAGSALITVRNNTAGSLSEAIVIRFGILKVVLA